MKSLKYHEEEDGVCSERLKTELGIPDLVARQPLIEKNIPRLLDLNIETLS